MIKENFAKTLETFINEGIDKHAIPSCAGSNVRVKNYLIRQTSKGYVVINTSKNCQVAFTNFKTSAVVIAKTLAEGKNTIREALRLDDIIFKNYNDAIFYKNIINSSSDQLTKETRRARLEIALDRAAHAKQILEDFIF
jgi:hypothetical protein